MQLNVWNDLAKAKRRWTEKKSHLEVDLSLNSFVDFLVVLAVLSPRPTGTSVLLCKGSRI